MIPTRTCGKCGVSATVDSGIFVKSRHSLYGVRCLCIRCATVCAHARYEQAKRAETPSVPDGMELQCRVCERRMPATLAYFKKMVSGSYGLTARCRSCINASMRGYQKTHKDTIKTKQHKNYLAHRAQRLASDKERYAKHRAEKIAYQTKYAAAHRDERRAYVRSHYEKHKAEYVARAAIWQKAHPIESAESHRRYRKKYPEKILAKSAKRRALMRAAGGSFTPDDLRWIYEVQVGLCCYCWQDLDGIGSVDHMTPLSRGGSNEATNIALCCRRCNSAKGARTVAEFKAALLGREAG